jgi:hypothetical protein
VVENRVLRRLFWPKMYIVTGERKKYILRILMISAPHIPRTGRHLTPQLIPSGYTVKGNAVNNAMASNEIGL